MDPIEALSAILDILFWHISWKKTSHCPPLLDWLF